jgi:phosphatidylserine/phosphatidylglycerophosphate/cardiolipin synthase-like enzyme
MPRKQAMSKGTALGSVLSVVILFVLGVIYALTGSGADAGNTSGEPTPVVFSTTETPPVEVPTGVTPVVDVSPTSIPAGQWWEVYFTDPLTINDPNQWQNSIEGILIEKINAATNSIHIAAFEFGLTPVAEALIAARQRGLDVRWITDDESGLEADEDPDRGQFAMLQNAGIEVISDTRSALMHNKFWIFDQQTVWTGSTNVTASAIFQQNNNVLVLHSPEIAAIYEREFFEMWDGQFGPRSPSTADHQAALVNGTVVQVYFSPEDDVLNRIIPIVEGAQSNIRFLAFSFTDYPLAQTMIDRHSAGVDVAGVYEKTGSETEGAELRTFWCARVPVRQDGNPRFLHDKVIVVDNRIVITGSFNFSNNATDNNDENVIIIDNPEIAALYMEEFGHVWSIATDIDPAKFTCQ